MSRAFVRSSGRATRRGTRLAFAFSGLAALGLSTVFVWHSAYADFTDATYPVGTRISTGTVALGDNDSGIALFSVTDLRPGAAASRCIVVTSTSTVPTVVRLYAPGRTASALSKALKLTVEAGTGASASGRCLGFTPTASVYNGLLSAFATTYAGGADSWTTTGAAGGESRTYQITYSLPTGATTGQGGSASLPFTWEAQTR